MNTFPYAKAIAACNLDPQGVFLARFSNDDVLITNGQAMMDSLSFTDIIVEFRKVY